MADRTYVFRLQGDSGSLEAATDAAGQRIDALSGKTSTFGAASVAADKAATAQRGVYTAATGRAAQQTAQLSNQVQDFFVQIQAGGSPLTAFIQQGSQLSAVYGGFGNATKAVLGLLSPTVLAFTAVAAAAGAATYGFIAGRKESEAFTKAMLVSNNAAGLTASGLETLTQQLASSTRASAGSARELVTALAASGEAGPQLIGPLADAMLRVQKVTGETTSEITKRFADLASAPAKFAAESNKAYNFITGDQYAYIKRLEEQGQKEEAALDVSRLLSAHFSGPLADSLNKTGSYTERASRAFGELLDWFRQLGREETAEQKLDSLNEKLIRLRNTRGQGSFDALGNFTGDSQAGAAEEEQLQQERTDAIREEAAKKRQAYYAAEDAAANKRQIAAIDFIDKLREQSKGYDLVSKKVAEYRQQIAALKGTQQEVSASQQAKDEAELRERYKGRGDRTQERLDDRFQQRSVALQQEGARLDAEIKSWELYGRSVDKARTAVLDLEIAQGKLKGISPTQIAQLRQLAQADDEKDRRLDQVKIDAGAADRLKALRAEANAKEQGARESEIARRLAAEETAGLKVGTQAYIDQAEQIRTWVNVKYDGALARQLEKDARAADNEVAELDAETRAIGQSTLERAKAAAALREYARARQLVAENPGAEAAINDARDKNIEKVNAGLERNYAASRRFETGVTTAFQRYGEEAANAAAYSEHLVGGSLEKLEDGLTTFVTTGKAKFGDLFKFMADEFIRNLVRMQIAQAAKGFSGLFTAGSANAAGGSNGSGFGSGSGYGNQDLGQYYGTSGVGAGASRATTLSAGAGAAPLSNASLRSSRASAVNGNVYVTNVGTNATVKSASRDSEGNWRLVLEEAMERAAQSGAERGHAMVARDLASGTGRAATALQNRGVGMAGSLDRRN